MIALLLAATAGAATLTVNVKGAESDAGQLVMQVYCDKDAWLDADAACHTVTAPLHWARGTLTLELPPGQYALTVFHDHDADGVMRTSWPIPLPKDASAISNNHRPKFGPPSWSAAVFDVAAEPLVQDLELIQP